MGVYTRYVASLRGVWDSRSLIRMNGVLPCGLAVWQAMTSEGRGSGPDGERGEARIDSDTLALHGD